MGRPGPPEAGEAGRSGHLPLNGYDIQNRRFRTTVGKATTHFPYHLNDRLIAELSRTGALLREYVRLENEPLLLAGYIGSIYWIY